MSDYSIIRNTLQPGKYRVKTKQGKTTTLDDMMPNILSKTAFTGGDVKAMMEAVVEETIISLARGERVVIDGLVALKVSLRGSFDTEKHVITKENAELVILPRSDKQLPSRVLTLTNFSKLVNDPKMPVITGVQDVTLETPNIYVPSSVIHISGKNLKLDSTQADEGVFFNDGTTQTRATIYSVISDKQLHVVVPLALSGTLKLSVRARYTPEGRLREGSYDYNLELDTAVPSP